ncbi:serine hydroxymethyltransferase [Candidatus Dojkabacteria bacterium]|nr:serine hydroxymethyltransferase [Candidatus Dojkabacteria bacterium]
MDIENLISKELKYQQQQLKLIPSENYVRPAVMKAVGSILMNKYAENYPGKRYYQGNKNMDEIETLCQERALSLFGLSPEKWHVNVQAVLGSIGNLAVYNSVLEPGDRILAMHLPHGGHLSHGWKLEDGKNVSFSGKIYDSYFYKVDKETETFDYDEIEKQAQEVRPKLIISGGTAYPRDIDHSRLGEIAKSIGAYYLADIAHEAGLIASGLLNSPFPHADFVTMTTRKTLRGPIGTLIFTRSELAEAIDRAVFPGLQGGPMINSIAGIAVALKEASSSEFREYSKQVILNAKTLSEELSKLGFRVISGGTEKHLILVDIRAKQPDGLIAAELLEATDIITNKNTIPYETGTPWRPTGIRLGTPAVTTRGMREKEMPEIASLIEETLNTTKFEPKTTRAEVREAITSIAEINNIKDKVHKLTSRFPIYSEL